MTPKIVYIPPTTIGIQACISLTGYAPTKMSNSIAIEFTAWVNTLAASITNIFAAKEDNMIDIWKLK
jgi:hypothetical protein